MRGKLASQSVQKRILKKKKMLLFQLFISQILTYCLLYNRQGLGKQAQEKWMYCIPSWDLESSGGDRLNKHTNT